MNKQEKEILLVDFDNTIGDSPQSIIECINEEFNKQFKITEKFGWDFEGVLPKEYVQRAKELFSEPKFFDKLKPITDSVEVLQRLSDKYEIIVVTKHGGKGVQYKEEWLNQHMPFIKRMITLHQDDYDKSFIKGDFLIDDKPECLLGAKRKFNILFGDYKWNDVLHMDREMATELIRNTTIKLYNWKDVELFLTSLKK